jgi:hypothetical protein
LAGSTLPVMQALAVAPTTGRLSVALLTPDVAAGRALIAGARAAVSDGAAVNLNVMRIGTGFDALRSAVCTALESGAQVVAALMNPLHLPALRDVIDAHDALFIVLTSGENVTRDEQLHPKVAIHSLGYWQGAHTLGRWSAQTFGGRALVAASFRESGYDALYSFVMGAEAAGASVETVITHLPGSNIGPASAIAAMRSTRPDFVYAAYTGADASAFAAAYRAAGMSVPLVTSPFFGPALDGAHTIQLAEGDAFAALGADTVNLLAQTAATGAAGLRQALFDVQLSTSRGLLTGDAATATITGQPVLSSVRGSELVRAGLLPAPVACEVCATMTARGPQTGFTNLYAETL